MALDADSERSHHAKVTRSLVDHLLPVFNGSTEAVFVFLDSEHKACNERLADLFGYTPGQWELMYPIETMFSHDTRKNVMATYYEKIIADRAPAQVSFTGVRKDGSTFDASILMVPISYSGTVFALCFVKPAG